MKKIIIVIFCGLLTCVNLMASEVINGLIYKLDSTNYTAKLLPSGNYSYAGDIYVHSRVKFEGNYYDVTKVEILETMLFQVVPTWYQSNYLILRPLSHIPLKIVSV